jgi:hypothetical protein
LNPPLQLLRLPLALHLQLLQPLHKVFDVGASTRSTCLLRLLLLPLLLLWLLLLVPLLLLRVLGLGHLPRLLVQAATAAALTCACTTAAHKPTIRPACSTHMRRPCNSSSSWCNRHPR